MPRRLKKSAARDLKDFLGHVPGKAQTRYRRIDDPSRRRQPEWSFGSVADYEYQKNKVEIGTNPGPLAYCVDGNVVLDGKPAFSFGCGICILEKNTGPCPEWHRRTEEPTQTPGPIYKPKYNKILARKPSFYFGCGICRREKNTGPCFHTKKEKVVKRSPGPIYEPKKDCVSNRPGAVSASLKPRRELLLNKERRNQPAPWDYNVVVSSKDKKWKGGYMGTRDGAVKQQSQSPGPVYLPKHMDKCKWAKKAKRQVGFPTRFKYADEWHKEKIYCGPGTYGPEILPKFERKTRKKAT